MAEQNAGASGIEASWPFSDLLRRYRERAGLTQEELAERAGLTREAISLLERGLRRRPQAYTVQALAEALDLPTEQRTRLKAAARRSAISADDDDEARPIAWSRNRTTPESTPADAGAERGADRSFAEGETRVLTILWARLADATENSASRPLEDAITLTEQVLSAMGAAILPYEGRIQRRREDGLLAFFGTPVAHENDGERAVLAALRLRAAAQQWGCAVTVGIASGSIYMGGTDVEYDHAPTAQGVVVARAVRLGELASRGQILVDEAVYRQTYRAVEFIAQPGTMIGVAQPGSAYAVDHPLPHPQKMRGIEGLRATLIGRDDDMASLTAALAAVQVGEGRLVTLIGEAGTGKSRLIAELQTVALAPQEGQPVPLWLEGRCLDLGVAASYAPFLDMLHSHFALNSEEDERARGDKIMASVDALIDQGLLAPARAEEILPVLGHLLAARFGNALDTRLQAAGPEQIKIQTFLALRNLFVTLATRQPVVLILEDLHWADRLSLDLLSLFLEELAQVPLLLACAYRPVRDHRVGHLTQIATHKCPDRSTEVHLHDLSPRQSREMVEALLSTTTLPETITRQILARAQGNPFFIEEMVRSLIDSGLLYRDGEVWLPRAESIAVTVPDTVQSVILSRVDRLDATLKHVLRSAAVIGRIFSRQLVGAVARLDDSEEARPWSTLGHALEQLEDRQLIYQERAVPEEEYSFQHALTQETIYQNMERRHRTQVHHTVAEAIERLYVENLPAFYERLAYHYAQAGVVEKSVDYQIKAGVKAQYNYLYEEALRYFQQALAQLEGSPVGKVHPEWMVTALHGQGMVLRLLDRKAEAEDCLRRAIALGHDLHQPARTLVLVYYLLGDVLYHLDRGAEQVQVGEEGLALLGDDTECTEAALMHLSIANGHALQGHLDQEYASLQRIARLLPTLPYSPYLGWLLWSVHALLVDKDVEQAREVVRHVESVAPGHNTDIGLAGMVRLLRAQIQFCIGDLSGAMGHMQVAVAHHAQRDTIAERLFSGWLAEMYLTLGDLLSAVEYAERVHPSLLPETTESQEERDERLLGIIALCTGDLDDAVAHLEAAVRSILAPSAVIKVPLGRAYLAQGRYQEAVDQFENALTSARSTGMLEKTVMVPPFALVPNALSEFEEASGVAPHRVLLPNALSGLEEATGSSERVRVLVERLRHESLIGLFLPLVSCLEPIAGEAVLPPHVHQEFTTPLSSAWAWNDPFGDCSYALQEGLYMTAANGRDLWHVNLSAPRLLQPAPSGDFVVQTLCTPATDDRPAIGGLLLWQDQENYLVLERGHWCNADIAFRGCLENADRLLGRGRLPGEQTWLRLERQGNTVCARVSADGVAWFNAGDIEFPWHDGELVGIHAIGMIDRTIYHGAYPTGTAIRFASFALGNQSPGS